MIVERNPNICIHYIVGVSVGHGIQPTAIAVVEQETMKRKGWETESLPLRVRHLERLPLDAGYPGAVAEVHKLLKRKELKDAEQSSGGSDLIVDITGTSRAVAKLMGEVGLKPITVTVTAGAGETKNSEDANDWRVSRTELIANLQMGYQMGRIKMSGDLELTRPLCEELQTVKLRAPTLNASDPESWREGPQDDLVLAVGLAVWRAGKDIPVPQSITDHWTAKLHDKKQW